MLQAAKESAVQLVRLVVEAFPGFRDEAAYRCVPGLNIQAWCCTDSSLSMGGETMHAGQEQRSGQGSYHSSTCSRMQPASAQAVHAAGGTLCGCTSVHKSL